MVGTGPFMFNDWTPGDHVTLVRNAGYWDPRARPYLDRIVFKPFADIASELKALQSGAVDFVQALDPASVKATTGDRELVLLDRGSGCNVTSWR